MTLKPLPMPPVERILPAIHAYWNAVKSASDTTTMLTDSSLVLMPLPHSNPRLKTID
jgi:hypothetical protein